MPIKSVPIAGFKGMDNIREFAIDLAAPRVILNAAVKPDGKIKKRQGYTKLLSLTAGHSLGVVTPFMLLADGTTLYSSNGITKTALGSIGLPQEPLSYTEVNELVYMSNSVWNGILDLRTNTLRDWGISIPEQPVLSLVAGNLPPGKYSVCTTNFVGGRISGNSSIAEITLVAEGGISVSNLPSGGAVWLTEPYGTDLLFGGFLGTVVAMPSQTDLLPSLWCQPPPKLENIALGHGRMWGSVKEFLYYSFPLSYELFRVASDFFYFPSPVTMVAPVSGGIFIGFEKETVFMSGKKVSEMFPIKVGDGVVPGSLAYADNFGNYKNNSISMLGNLDYAIPVWMGRFGIFAGMHNGSMIELTSRRLRYDVGKKAAALFRMSEGQPQYLVGTAPGNTIGFGDSVTCEVIRNGRVFLGDFEDHSNDWVGLAEIVSAEIT
jgi:hypothetical protein